MKSGDLVRFNNTHGNWQIGLLIEYHKWEKIARILFEGKLVSYRPINVQLHTMWLAS